MQTKEKATLALTSFLLLMAWSGTWFEISATGTYTEGLERSPTITTEYIIDASQESFEMSIENATPLLLYWIEREDVTVNAEETGNGSTNDKPSPEGPGETVEGGCQDSCLDQARGAVQVVMIALLASLCLSYVRPSIYLRTGVLVVWLIGSVVIVTAVPIAAAYDFGVTGAEGSEGSSTGGFDTATQDNSVSVNQFAHFEQSEDAKVRLSGIAFYFDSVGFDLGLLDEGDRQGVVDQKPSPGDPGYESLIRFHGELEVGPGEILTWWIFTSPVLILNLLGPRSQKLEEE